MTLRVVRVRPGEEVMESATRQLAGAGITNAAIVSVIGAVDACAISTMKATDASVDLVTEYNQPSELSGSGEVAGGRVHLHCVVGLEGNETRSGHLHWARVETFFVNLYVQEVEAPA